MLFGLGLVIGACNNQTGAGAGPAAGVGTSVPAEEGTNERLALAPFQKSAFTLVGAAGGRPSASTFERLAGHLTMRDGQVRTLEFSAESSSLVSSSDKLAARLKDKDFFDARVHARVALRAHEARPIAPEKTTPGAATHLLVGELVVLDFDAVDVGAL
jgi:hypothetical protein